MAKRKPRRVKKWAPRSEGKRDARIHCRIPARVYDTLNRAAGRNGWTVSAEVVHRLSESFALPATSTQAVMMIVGDTIDAMGRASGQSWLTDPTLHKEARAAMEAAFDLLAPSGEAVARDKLNIPDGRLQFQNTWDEIRRYNPKTPIDGTKPRRAAHQRRLTWLREALGTLPDRVVLWGRTGREARRYSQEMAPTKEIANLLVERDEKGLDPQRLKRLQELFDQAPAEVKQRLDPKDLSLPGPFKAMHLPTEDEDPPL
jgi:hypothetical protein